MSISKGNLTIDGCLLKGENPLPLFRDRQHHKTPTSNGTMLDEELDLFGYEAAFRILPYTMQDRYDRNRKELTLDTLILENESLRAEFLPDWGGRLYSLWDKKGNRELLFKNPVMQPSNLAIRDAWFSGGIEWNIAQLGHTFSTCDKVFFAKVTAPDDYEFLRMYDYERTRGLLWQIDFHLPEDSPYLCAHVTIINDHKQEFPMYWWTNIAVREEPGCRIFSGTKEVLYIEAASQAEGAEHRFGHGQLPFISSLPGKDASYPLHFDFASEYFFQNPTTDASPWEAISYNDGQVFFERSTQPLRIRKMFCWGSHRGGRNWCDFLSVPGQGDYVEIQAGLAPTQLHGMKMAGESKIAFTQIFGSLSVPPSTGNGVDYEESRSSIEQAVTAALSEDTIHSKDAYFQTLSALPCTRILHLGHGWGALENVRRTVEHEPLLPRQLSFPEESLQEPQLWWKELLLDHSPQGIPSSFLTDDSYLPYLEQLQTRCPDSAVPLLLRGIIDYENGRDDSAIANWEKALAIEAMPILYRNLAFAKRQHGRLEVAIQYMEQITPTQYVQLDFAYLQEYFTMLGEANHWEKLFTLYEELPQEYQEKERLYLLACEAAMHRKDWTFLIPAFQKEYASIREGETKITKIWLEYAKAHDIDPKELPNNLDLRMFE